MKKINILLITLLILVSCVKDSDYSTPLIECAEPSLAITNSISQIKEMYSFGGTEFDAEIIIEGYVVSSDKSGNIYKSLSIQDKPENPTAAIKIAIDQTNIYTKYEVGRKIFIKLKGLAIDYSYGSLQLGKFGGSELSGISPFEVDNYIIRSCEVSEIIPKKISISELNKDYLEMLIELENVQFSEGDIGESYGNVDNTQTVNRKLQSFHNDCSLLSEVLVRNSGYAKFKNELIPEGKGNVVAIFSNYYNDFQLYLRETEDVKLTEERCDYSVALSPTISLSEVKDLFQGSRIEFGVETNYITEGLVISTDELGNFEKRLLIQDKSENPTAGIQILIENDAIFEKFNVGDKLFLKLNKLYLDEVDGVLTIGYPKNNLVTEITEGEVDNYIFNTGENESIVPTIIEISEIGEQKYQNTLVTVSNVQLLESELGKAFTYFSGENHGARILETCGESKKLSVFTNGKAAFANELFPKGKGDITGVLSTNLELRTFEDVNFSNDFESCPVIIPKIMITEIADPVNATSARFIELFNAGEHEIDLQGWKLNKYLNGSESPSSGGLDLSGHTLLPGAFLIIANTGYSELFNDIPKIETTYISGNGDDAFELVDGSNTRIDIYGIIGEDGTNTNWEYLDGRAVRKPTINNPNIIFNSSEWTVFSKASNDLISNPNSPKTAPNDYNPNLR